jgi:hypothetical protein
MELELKLVRAKRFKQKLQNGLPVYANLENNTRYQIIHINACTAETIHGELIPLISIANFD